MRDEAHGDQGQGDYVEYDGDDEEELPDRCQACETVGGAGEEETDACGRQGDCEPGPGEAIVSYVSGWWPCKIITVGTHCLSLFMKMMFSSEVVSMVSAMASAVPLLPPSKCGWM
jgi:hypothetical protein